VAHRVISDKAFSRARSLRSNMTDAELRLWTRLRAHRLDGLSFRRQVPIGCYIADFVCLAERLIIEVDGGQHGSSRDEVRDAWLRSQDFTILRFWNNDVLSNIEGVLEKILESVRASPPSLTLPRKGGGNTPSGARGKDVS
jgi:very-short-patch-repair endonuclease